MALTSVVQKLTKIIISGNYNSFAFRKKLDSKFRSYLPFSNIYLCSTFKSKPENLILKKPKPPLTTFLTYLKAEGFQLRQKPEFSDLSYSSEQWNNLDKNIRANYEIKYQQELENFRKEKEEYECNLTPELRNQIASEIKKRKEKLNILRLKRQCHALGKPKKPPSPYNLYCKEKMKTRGDVPITLHIQKIAAEWHKLDENKKKYYIEQSREAYREYLKSIQEWELSMLEKGHTDLIHKLEYKK